MDKESIPSLRNSRGAYTKIISGETLSPFQNIKGMDHHSHQREICKRSHHGKWTTFRTAVDGSPMLRQRIEQAMKALSILTPKFCRKT